MSNEKLENLKICNFCAGSGEAYYFDFYVCYKTCGNINCNKGFDCEIAGGIDLCPDCGGLGKISNNKIEIFKN